MARHEPPDHSRGDERTLGGYMAVHARPAAFEGKDGLSYSVAIETEDTGDRARPVGAFLLFVRWAGAQPEVSGHLETPFLAWGATPAEASSAAGEMLLHEVKALLDGLLASSTMSQPAQPWWEVMQREGLDDDDAAASG